MSELNKTKIQITSEEDFVDKLSAIKGTEEEINFDLLLNDTKSTIETKQKDIETFLVDNVDFDNYTEEEKDKMYDDVFEIYDELKGLVKNAACNFSSTGIEIKTLDKKLHQSVEYNVENLFYGLHLKKNFLNDLPKVKGDFDMYELSISFSNAIAMYHVLSTLTVKGLNKESFALAHILYSLTEISKIYQHYDNMTSRLHNSMMKWNLGLTSKDAKQLETAVTEQILADEIAKQK